MINAKDDNADVHVAREGGGYNNNDGSLQSNSPPLSRAVCGFLFFFVMCCFDTIFAFHKRQKYLPKLHRHGAPHLMIWSVIWSIISDIINLMNMSEYFSLVFRAGFLRFLQLLPCFVFFPIRNKLGNGLTFFFITN